MRPVAVEGARSRKRYATVARMVRVVCHFGGCIELNLVSAGSLQVVIAKRLPKVKRQYGLLGLQQR